MNVDLLQDETILNQLPEKWEFLPFKKVLKDKSGGNIKIKSKNTLTKGEIPVVDQGAKIISGFTERKEAKFKGKLPIILFGDHTRNLKFIDFEFAIGADGTKVLEVINENTFPKFVYYYLTTIDIIDTGYNRHFKFIKDLIFPLPPLETQKRIAGILDDAAALRDKTAKLLEEYDQLAQSIFLEMFGDPVTNSKDFKKVPINKLGKIITGSTPSSKKENMFGGEIPFITPSDLDSNEEFKRKVTKQGAENSRIVNKNALLICCIGATIGKRRMADKKSAFNQQINAIEWSNKIDPKFGYWVFNWVKYEVIQRAISTTLPIMKKSEFEKIKCPVPPIELQTQFAEKIGLIEQQKVLVKEELQESEDLFQCLLQKAFKGELV